MDPKKLLALAASLGLSQAAMAAHLGISKAQVARWSIGTRPIPRKHLDPLWDLIQQTFHRSLEAGKIPQAADDAPTLWAMDPPRSLATAQTRQGQIFQAVTELGLAHAERHGEGPSARISSVLIALDSLPTDERERRKPANILRLLELSKQLADAAILLAKIGPLQDAMEETDHAHDHRP